MDSPLDILSAAAAGMVNVDKSGKLGNHRELNEVQSFGLPSGPISKRSLSTSVIVPDLDEPLDMSLKSRNRNASQSQEPVPKTKKFRPSVISFSGSDSNVDPYLDERDSEEPLSLDTKPLRQVIITHDEHEDGGLEEHFRRSLSKEYSVHDDSEGVDAHFSRSLGPDAWREIQKKSKITKGRPHKQHRLNVNPDED